MTLSIECVVNSKSQVGEGAVWDDRDDVLWWVDIPAGLIHRYDPESKTNTTVEYGEPVGCLALREQGGLVLATKSGFWFYDPQTGKKQQIADPESHLQHNRFNDGTTDARGRFWAGTMKDGGDGKEAIGRFYRLDADLSVTPWRDGFYTTNGSAFSADGKTFYFSDSDKSIRTIWASDYDEQTGTPGEPRVFFDTNAVAGRPDGGTVDADNCYWQAGVSGWQLYRISATGELLTTVDLPIERPSKPMFGGKNLDTLFFTSIGLGLTEGSHQPQAGGLFAISGLGVTGLKQHRFAG
jgi:sugar lactone lactonase YvrE